VSHITDSIYNDLLKPINDDEWTSTIASLPNNKAARLSNIPYEFIKHLSNESSTYLREIIDLCLQSDQIPSEWKDATIYPIPKPHDWDCFLKNTHPITLLDTARKLMNKILYKRLDRIFTTNNVLTGGNFAGLSGGSCDTPIAVLKSILHDAKLNNSPLFLFFLDISKAFDAMDRYAL
jgi:hypothetical protein